MLLFRSEQHVVRWCSQWNRTRGGTLSLAEGWRLAKAWYGDRLSPNWQPLTTTQAQRLFNGLGLTGAFWRLAD